MRIHTDNQTPIISPHINVTPLIDVLLVLLIIFMVVSPLKPSRFKALVPQPPDEHQPSDPNPLTLVVTINKDLQLALNKQGDMGSINDTEKLSVALAQIFQARKEAHTYRFNIAAPTSSAEDPIEKTVFIKASRSLPYGDIVKVIDGVKGAGASPVGLQIDDLAQ